MSTKDLAREILFNNIDFFDGDCEGCGYQSCEDALGATPASCWCDGSADECPRVSDILREAA